MVHSILSTSSTHWCFDAFVFCGGQIFDSWVVWACSFTIEYPIFYIRWSFRGIKCKYICISDNILSIFLKLLFFWYIWTSVSSGLSPLGGTEQGQGFWFLFTQTSQGYSNHINKLLQTSLRSSVSPHQFGEISESNGDNFHSLTFYFLDRKCDWVFLVYISITSQLIRLGFSNHLSRPNKSQSVVLQPMPSQYAGSSAIQPPGWVIPHCKQVAPFEEVHPVYSLAPTGWTHILRGHNT